MNEQKKLSKEEMKKKLRQHIKDHAKQYDLKLTDEDLDDIVGGIGNYNSLAPPGSGDISI